MTKTSLVLKFDSDTHLEMPLLKEYLANHDAELIEEHIDKAGEAIAEYTPSVIVTGAALIGKDTIDLAHHHGLRGIVKAGAGMDNIDVTHARSLGILVLNIPAYAAESVAEHTVMFMLSLLRKIWPLQKNIREEGWVSATPTWLGRELHGKTIGLIGFGHIAKRVARITHFGFEMSVLAYDPFVSAEDMAKVGVQKATELSPLLEQSDVVSVHSILDPSTANMIGAEQLRLMKPSALLINVSRGGIVDEEALLSALERGSIGGAGLDVFSKEPLSVATHPIISEMAGLDNVLLSSHLAWFTLEANERLQQEVGQKCIGIIQEELR